MKNYEKYADKIKEFDGTSFCNQFIAPYILKSDKCNLDDCGLCNMLQNIWLLEEYEEPKEPEIDWNKVEVDTPTLVRNSEDEDWYRRYFAEYKDGVVYTWVNGATSWNATCMTEWKQAKLAD